jgi:hypothetical protein
MTASASRRATTERWRPIATFRGADRHEVDLWMQVYASPHSFGMSDAFRVVDAYRVEGKWFHRWQGKEQELYADYITHWMPKPKPPRAAK